MSNAVQRRLDMPAHTASWIYGEPLAVSNCTHVRAQEVGGWRDLPIFVWMCLKGGCFFTCFNVVNHTGFVKRWLFFFTCFDVVFAARTHTHTQKKKTPFGCFYFFFPSILCKFEYVLSWPLPIIIYHLFNLKICHFFLKNLSEYLLSVLNICYRSCGFYVYRYMIWYILVKL